MSGVRVLGWGAALPDKVLTNKDLEKTLDTDENWILERSGIRERRIGNLTAELAIAAGNIAIDFAEADPSSIDLMILATTTPDQVVPATSARVHQALGLAGGAFDLNAACSGFVYSLVVAESMLRAGAHRALVIGADTLSRITNWSDRNTAVLFGDGAGALLLEAATDDGQLLSWDLGLDGGARKLLHAEIGGKLQMEGREVFKHAVRAVVESARRTLSAAKVEAKDIKLLVPHQANLRIIRAACERLEIPMERAAIVLDRTGNTSAASIPLALVDAIQEQPLDDGDLVLLVGFGAGMTWASALIRWENPS